VLPLLGAKPIAVAYPACIGINTSRVARDVAGSVPGLAIGLPFPDALELEGTRKRASIFERAPTADAPLLGAKPIAVAYPASIGIKLVRVAWDVDGSVPGLAIGVPFPLAFEPKTMRESASVLERAPTATTLPGAEPIAPAHPTGVGVNQVWVPRDVVGLFAGPAIYGPIFIDALEF